MDPTPNAETAEESTSADPPPPSPQQQSLRDYVDNPWVILGVLFGVTGFLGLPALWVSRGFGLWGKIGVSILVTAYTGLLMWVAWLSVRMVYVQLQQYF